MYRKFITIFGVGVLALFSLSFDVHAQVYTGVAINEDALVAHKGIFANETIGRENGTIEPVKYERSRLLRQFYSRFPDEGNIGVSRRSGDIPLSAGGGTVSLSARGEDIPVSPGNGELPLSLRGGDISMSPGGGAVVVSARGDIALLPGGTISVSGRSGVPGSGVIPVSAGGGDISVPSEVPLPGALWLIGSGFAGIAFLQRKKQ